MGKKLAVASRRSDEQILAEDKKALKDYACGKSAMSKQEAWRKRSRLPKLQRKVQLKRVCM